MAEGKFVGYYRVSTQKQGASGLGLEAQKDSVAKFLNGGRWELVAEFVEVESGRKTTAQRPQLAAALAMCKRQKATLIVAKLDRLARDVKLILSLIDSGVMVRFVDFPEIPDGAAGRFMLTMLAAAAEFERRLISERTKAGLAVAKSRGVKLGATARANLRPNAQERQKAANDFAHKLRPLFDGMQARGLTQRGMVDELNTVGVPAPRGGRWGLSQVQRVIARLTPVTQQRNQPVFA